MYQEQKHNYEWVKLLIRILIAFLILILSIKLISIIVSNRSLNKNKDRLDINLNIVSAYAKEYFTEDKFPDKLGEKVRIYLKDINDKKVKAIKDNKGNKCNLNESYIEATKLDSEYQIKTYIDCNGVTDYQNDFIPMTTGNIVIKPTTTTKTTTSKVKTTKRRTTTKRTTTSTTTTKKIAYRVEFNTNGGNMISFKEVLPNKIVSKPIPVREGYTFVGWYYQGVLFDFNTKINHNYVLVAKWSKN